jgi:capsular exopolysaccharide synthesis family protein
MRPHSTHLDLTFVLRTVKRRLPILILCLVLVPGLAVGLSFLQKEQYTAEASLLFRDAEFDQKLFGNNAVVQSQGDPDREAATNLEAVSVPKVAALTAARLRTLDKDQVSDAIDVSSTGQSDIISIEATGGTPRLAARLANVFADQYIGFRRRVDRATIRSAQRPLQRRIAALPQAQRSGGLGQSLQQRLGQLEVLASLQTGNAELLQPAEVPREASAPKPLRNGALGLFFGALLGVALVIAAEALDRRMRDPAEVEEIFERPLLAHLKKSAELATADPALLNVSDVLREDFRMLWVNLRYFSLSRDIRSVLITSADRNDGKSTVAWGLAVAAASTGTRTLLIEADLRNPTLANRFGLEPPGGLPSVLAGDADFSQAIVRLPLPVSEKQGTPSRSMDVLLAGRRPPDPAELLQSQRMAEFLGEVENQYDLVVIDSPPAAIVSDAIPLATIAKGVAVVARLGNTGRDHLRRLHQQLDHLDAPVLGVVVNSVEPGQPYGYGYGYGYGEREARPIFVQPADFASSSIPQAPPARASQESTGGDDGHEPASSAAPEGGAREESNGAAVGQVTEREPAREGAPKRRPLRDWLK